MKPLHILLATLALMTGVNVMAQKKKAAPNRILEPSVINTDLTFCNPLDVIIGNERAYRGGEPIVLIYKDDYYLFVSHRKGYWYSQDMQNWTYVDAPDYPGGVVSVVEMDGKLIGCSMNNKNVYRAKDPKKGIWEKIGELSSDRYGDANMFVDDDGRLYMYYGWSQIMPFRVVELDKKTFKEKGEPTILFWSDIKNHGFEVRKPEDVIYSIFNGRRDYFAEELPWIEGPYVIKHGGKYYLQYAAIGLEFISYSHGIYVADNPLGPFVYSEHNPLTFKTSGFQVGAGHGSTFHDKKGNLWTICMIPAQYGEGGRGSELAIYPTAVDEQGVMYSNTAYGDYPQYYANHRKVGGVDNYTDWKLLSVKKKAVVSSTFDKYAPENALDEDFKTCWAAATGDAGEYFMVDLGGAATLKALQLNWDHIGATQQAPGRQNGLAPAPQPEMTYQCYEVLTSLDGQNWSTLISKPRNMEERKHDYIELKQDVEARYVKVVNISTYDGAKFCIKDLRIFGATPKMSVKKVENFLAVRNPADRREANVIWEPVPGADGYVVRYGIEPNKLYNSYIVYDKNQLYMHSLNTAPEKYYFEVEAFDSGLDIWHENTLSTQGIGAELQLVKRPTDGGFSAYRQMSDAKILMMKEGQTEYVFEGIEPGAWILNHAYGPVLWAGELTAEQLISSEANPQPTLHVEGLTLLGVGSQITGSMKMKVIPGKESGKLVVIVKE